MMIAFDDKMPPTEADEIPNPKPAFSSTARRRRALLLSGVPGRSA